MVLKCSKIYIVLIISIFININSNNLLATEPPQELFVKDIIKGSGRIVTEGKELAVHYEGWLYDKSLNIDKTELCQAKGKPFDSSIKRGMPFSFIIGEGKVIKGWEKGLLGMHESGKRCLIIPPHLAYGKKAVPNVIPANSTLIFEVLLLGVR